MEELRGPIEPNSGVVVKTIRSTNFRCVTCKRVFRSEFGVKKHLENNHGIVDPPAILYETFVGLKREMVLKEPSIESETVDPSINSSSTSGVSYNCSMCEKVYPSFEGVLGHLLSFHGIKYPVNSSSESMKTPAKPVIKFITPTIENKKMKKTSAQESQIPHLVEKKVEKTQGPKRKHKDESPKEKKNPKTDYCKSLNNVFTSGNIQMRSLNLWNKKEKGTSPPYQNNTQETRHPENSSYQPNLCEDGCDKSHNTVSDYVNAQTQNIIPQSQNVIAQSQNMIPQSKNMIPQSHMSVQSKSSSPLSGVSNKINSQNSFHQPQNNFELPQTIHTKQSDSRNKLNKMRTERKKKTCNDPECRLRGPCAEEDCGICQFCQNRNLK